MRALVDRIVEGIAVLLVGDDQIEHHLPADKLPEGAGEGAWLRVRESDDGLEVVGRDEDGEQRQREQAEERVARLRKRSRRFRR